MLRWKVEIILDIGQMYYNYGYLLDVEFIHNLSICQLKNFHQNIGNSISIF